MAVAIEHWFPYVMVEIVELKDDSRMWGVSVSIFKDVIFKALCSSEDNCRAAAKTVIDEWAECQ